MDVGAVGSGELRELIYATSLMGKVCSESRSCESMQHRLYAMSIRRGDTMILPKIRVFSPR